MDLPQKRLCYQCRRGKWTILVALLGMVLGACAGPGPQGGVAYGGFSGQRLMLGPLSRAEQTLRLQVTACLYAASTRAALCRHGQGEARQEGVGMVYEFRGDRLDFEQNAVGRATKQAVVLAVRELVASLTFLP